MTRAVRRNYLKDDSCSIVFPLSDHLRNHVHLTNCIHLKHHMHRHSPMVSERTLVKDLIALQRSRSLRDPSTSPPSWISPFGVDLLGRKPAKDGSVHSGRRSVGVDRRAGRLSISSPLANSVATSKVAAEEAEEKIRKKARSKTLSKRLEELPNQTDNEASIHGNCSGLKQPKKRRLRGVRRVRGSIESRDVDSRSIPQGHLHQNYHIGEETEMDVGRAPRNGCGIPWNWSRLHHRGKSILEAGRSLSCGLSDPRLRKADGSLSQNQRDTSDHMTSSTGSDSEALPLLLDPPDSPGNRFLVRDYSGELEIFTNNSSRHEQDSDLDSEARNTSHRSRHRSLTQKYMPKTFKDLVGQSLVAQALSNAVLRRKVGLIYVFYGPHGTGKTSCARVFSKALNCQSGEHPKPCDGCTSCISHNLGKSRNVTEIGPVSAFDYETILENVFDNAMMSPLSSQYRVFIIDDSDTLPADSWGVISKVIDRAPRHVVFILVSSSIDHLPHIIMSRCQKFFFPKLKESDIVCKLQWVATSEGLEIDKDALKLVASRSDGSLRDAEMTLDQLSLLGQRISLPLVQELVGLVSDEKLVDLLDLALSADTVNTVKSLREIMETGVEPLALMSQLATIITDILAGSYVFTRERLRRKFFRRSKLSKEDMEKLRQALKTLSEAEKQLRTSSDKSTWLTAALLQLAPDQQYTLPTSSGYTSLNNSPMGANYVSERDLPRSSLDGRARDLGLSRGIVEGNHSNRGANDSLHDNRKRAVTSHISRFRNSEHTLGSPIQFAEASNASKDYEQIWRVLLDSIQSDSLKQFLFREAKLSFVSLGTAPTVQLTFISPTNKAKAEKFRAQILQAFESALHSAVRLEIRCEPRKGERHDAQHNMANHRGLPSENIYKGTGSSQCRVLHNDPLETENNEIVEVAASPQAPSLQQQRRQSIVRGKVSLAHVIQHAENGGWSRRKAISIAEKLEQDNLRLEPRSRNILCCSVPRIPRRKIPHLRIRTQKPRYLLKIMTCGRYLGTRSPR